MMNVKTVFFVMLVLCLMGFSMNASAVTDPNIISGVERRNPDANSGDTEPNLVSGGLMEGDLIFIDRTMVFGDIDRFSGIDYIQNVVDDKDNPSYELDVTVNKAGTLFLIIDNRVGDEITTDPPTLGSGGTGIMPWVMDNGFTQTGYTIDISTPATVYSLALAGAGTTTLYAQNDGGSRVMYVVAAVPAGWNYVPAVSGVPASAILEPGESMVVDTTITDDGYPGAVISAQWNILSQPVGSVVTFNPDDTSEDVTIDFSDLGEYTLELVISDGEQSATRTVNVSVELPQFAVEATNWVEAVNDTKNGGPTGHYKPTQYMYARNHSAPRRRIQLISYDISGAKEAGKVFANSYLTLQGHKCGGGVGMWVYGVKEDFDNFDLDTGSWSTLPGVTNTPIPPMEDQITYETHIDKTDVSPLLLFDPQTPNNVWSDTDDAPASLDEFLNADNDGTILLLFATFTPQDADLDIFARDYGTAEPVTGLGGIILRGNVLTPTWATNPNPVNNTSQSTSLAQLSWTNPTAVGNLTCDVWIGTGEPNDPVGSGDGFTLLADDITGNSASLSGYTMAVNTEYNWIVNVTDDGTGQTTQGYVWTFNTNNAYPTVEMENSFQYLWLNNNGDPNSATAVINATASDDGFPNPILSLLWEQVSAPEGVEVVIDPNNVEDITLTLPAVGTYVFQLSASDGDLVGTNATQIFVGATPCEAAQAKPGYEANIADLNDDCYVDLTDFLTLAENWLVCNPLMDTPCN